MKKFTKLLSVLLAVVMILSTMSMSAFAYQEYGKTINENDYNVNDQGFAMSYTDEQRASYLADLLNGLLASLNIKTSIPVIGDVNLTSLDATFDTLANLENWITGSSWLINLGFIEELNWSKIDGADAINLGNSDGATKMLETVLAFLNDNADNLAGLIEKGSIDVGILNGALGATLGTINELLADVPDFIKENLYWLGHCHMPDGIGNDPQNPNDLYWDDMTAEQKAPWTVDRIVELLIKDALLAPRWTTNITDKSQNDIASDPAKYGIDASYIHEENVGTVEEPVYNYYIYGVQKNDGTWAFTQSGVEDNKHYIQHWDPDSILVPENDRDDVLGLLDFQNQSLYTIADKAILWAYDAYGAQNLNGQFRATLMQFTGAVNNGLSNSPEDEAIKETLRNKMAEMRAKGYKDGVEDPSTLSDAFAETDYAAGNKNFMYFALDNKPFAESEELYYIVEWYDWYEYYKVDTSNVGKFFELADWEYQVDDWAVVSEGWTGGESVLKRFNNIAGNILKEIVPSVADYWAFDAKGAYTNANIEENLNNLIKQFVKQDTATFFGKDFVLPADFDTYELEDTATMIAMDLVTWLMPALVLPEKDAKAMSIEEVAVYAVREFIAEIMPEYSWDAKIAAAKTDADYLDILLNMGTSIGAYYLKEVAGLGTRTDLNGTTTTVEVPMGPATDWNTQLNFILDEMINLWIPRFSDGVIEGNKTAFESGNALTKLSAIANSLFPGLLSLITGCEGNGYAVDLNVVKDLLAGVLNGDFVSLVEKLYRNTTGYANKAVYPIIVNMLKDFFGGLGCAGKNGWADLTAPLDGALTAQNPLDSIITKTNLKLLIQGLIKTLYSVRGLWLQDGLALIMQIAGTMNDSTFNGVNASTDSNIYRGASVTVKPTMNLNVKGLASVWYDKGYKNGNFVKDETPYSAVVTNVQVVDMAGNVKADTGAISATVNANTATPLPDMVFSPDATAKAYMLKVSAIVKTPYNVDMNNGEPMVFTDTFIASAEAAGDELMNPAPSIDWGDKWVTDKYQTVIYIDENTPLSYAESFNIKFTNQNADNITVNYADKSFFIEGYGYATKDGIGAVTLNEYTAGAATWNVRKNGGAEQAYEANNSYIPFFWNWTFLEEPFAGAGRGALAKGKDKEISQWMVDGVKTRADYPDAFTRFSFASANFKVGYWKDFGKWYAPDWRWTADTKNFGPLNIMLYNSYGLEGLINSCINSGKTSEDYTADTWATYVAAIDYATEIFYQARNINDFDTKNVEGGVSKFKLAADKLTAAVKALKPVAGDDSAGDFNGTEKAAFAALLADLKDEPSLSNKDYIMYRWLKYYNENAYLWNVYNSTVAPKKGAELPEKLAGIPDEMVSDAVNAVLAKYAGLGAGLDAAKDKPTDEEKEAADKANAAFYENLPKIDLDTLQIDRIQMNQYRTRLIADGKYMNYLTAALDLVNGKAGNLLGKAAPVQADYTPESWAAFAKAKTEAEDITADNLPHEIHEARYTLLVAYKNLVPAAQDADFSALEALLNEETGKVVAILKDAANAKLAADATVETVEEALAQLIKAAGIEITLDVVVDGKADKANYVVGGDSTGTALLAKKGMLDKRNSQADIDAKVAEIEAALANFGGADPEIFVPEGSAGHIADKAPAGFTGKFLYGINPGDDINVVFGANEGTLRVNGPVATGTTVDLLDNNGEVYETYTIIIFGDVTGDGAIDGLDTLAVNEYDLGYKAALDGAKLLAANVEVDGVVDGLDTLLVNEYDLGYKASIDQGKGFPTA